jgi:hypothetical protein
MLPGVRQRVGGGLPTEVRSVGGDEGAPEWSFDGGDELVESNGALIGRELYQGHIV